MNEFENQNVTGSDPLKKEVQLQPGTEPTGNQGQQFTGYDPYTGQPIFQNTGNEQAAYNQSTNTQQAGYNQNAGTQQNGYNQNTGYQQTGYDQNPGYQQTGYNQNPGYQQNGYQQGAGYAGSNEVPPTPKKKSGAKIAIAVIAGIVVVGVLGIGIAAAFKVFGGDHVKPEQAFKNTLAAAENSSYNNIFGTKEMFQECIETGYEADTSLTMEQSDGEVFPGSLTLNLAVKADNKNFKFDVIGNGKMSGITIDDCEFYMDRDSALVSIPILYDKAIELDYSGDFAGRLEDSELASLSGMTSTTIDQAALLVQIIQECADAKTAEKADGTVQSDRIIKDFFANVETSKADAKKVEIDGKERKCKGYTLTITEEDVTALLEGYKELSMNHDFHLSEEVLGQLAEYGVNITSDTANYENIIDSLAGMDDIEANVYIYKGQIAAIDAESDDLEFTYETEGGSNYLENMEMSYQGVNGDMEIVRETTDDKESYETSLKIISKSLNDSFTLKASYDKKTQDFKTKIGFGDDYVFNCKGTITELNKGKSVNMDLDKVEVLENDDIAFKCSGKFSLGVLSETVEKPDMESVEILGLSQMELYSLILEFGSALK